MDEQVWTYLVPGNTMKLQPGMSAMRELHPRRVGYEKAFDLLSNQPEPVVKVMLKP